MRKLCSMLSATLLSLLAFQAGTEAHGAVAQDRITQPIENANVVPVANTVSPLARTASDEGLADNSKVLDGMRLVFKRSDAQEAGLQALLKAQQAPGSAQFHQWLTPAQFGEQFGMSAEDITKATAWLQGEGFTVTWVAQSSNAIGFSGSIASVERAFQTQIHNYRVDGEVRYANATQISVPGALAGLVAGVGGLNNFRVKPKFRQPATVRPRFTSGQSGNHYLTPPDLATIYDIGPLYSAGFTGKGITIAIMGQTDIVAADITDFRGAALLPANAPTVVTVPGTTAQTATAGAASGDLAETDLDLEWSGGIATGASVVLVNSDNVFTSLQYTIQNGINGVTVPIISVSYGGCESALASDIPQLDPVLAQANAQGETVLLASGDTGAADCDNNGGTTPTVSASNGLAIDYPGSSVYVTDVGGTEFSADGTAASPTTGGTKYWTAASGTTDLISSAISYIPEMAWNDTTFSIANQGGLSATGGGVSTQFLKPGWQSGVAGIPADGHRDVPDIAFPASPDHDGLLYCTQVQTTGSGTTYVSSCQATSFRVSDTGQTDDQTLTTAGGTSFAAPSIAGVLAVVEQKLALTGGGLGNINPALYALAGNATTYASAFHDVTTGNNQVPCTAGSPNCPAGTGAVIGYTAGTGYDQTTGLGSLDANNFATAYAALLTATSTTTTLTAVPAGGLSTGQAVTFTATVAPNTAGGTPAGTVTFVLDGVVQSPAATLSSASPFTATLAETSGLTTGTHTVVATFNPSSNSFLGSTSQTITVKVTAPGTAATTTTVTANPTTFGLGSTVTLTATVTATTPGTLTGPLIFTTGGKTIGVVNQVSIGSGNTATATFSVTAATASLGFAAGTDTITAAYQGDVYNAPSTGTTTVTVSNPSITVTATPITISSPSPGNSGTSTITLTSTGGYAGTAVLTATADSLNANYGFGSTGASTANVTLTAGGTGTTTITITTVAATGNLQKGSAGSRRQRAAAGGMAAGCILLLLIPGIRRKRWPVALAMLVLLSVGAGMGCGGGTAGGAPKGTYNVTVTATDSSNANITGNGTFVVTVN